MGERHLARLFRQAAVTYGHRTATRVRRGTGWSTMTYERLAAEVEALGRTLIDLGVEPGDRVAIFSGNRPEWSEADLAVLSACAVVVPVYHTSTTEELRYVLDHAGVTVAFVSGSAEVETVKRVWDRLPELRTVITFDAVRDADPRVRSLDEVRAEPPSKTAAAELEQRLEQAEPDDLASIIYSSGTTGTPKGAMLSHAGFVDQCTALLKFFDFGPSDTSLCFLPLAHALERAWTFCLLSQGALNTYVTDPRTIAEMLTLVRPSLLVSVPRLYDKVHAAVHEQAATPTKRRVLEWSLKVGRKAQDAYAAGRRPSPLVRAQLGVADRLVLRKVRDAMGGPKNVMACGGAALLPEVEEFFSAAGMLICQGYGMTESSPLMTFNSPQAHKVGSVGRAMAGSELRIAEDGEVWYRGPNVMKGYWRDEELTAQTLVDGWLRTGDVGRLDGDGFLFITDRMKDLIVTAGGKNVAPAPIEGRLLADPFFEQAVVMGDGKPYLTLLVKPSLPQLEALGRRLELTWGDLADLIHNRTLLDDVKERVAAVCASFPKHEQVKDLRLVLDEFTQENGLLTPTLKVRRREVAKRFGGLVDEMYAAVAR